ncbi:MAG: alkaline phosphatase family protein [Bacteroidales bacterium]|nr:alkaline phosphatase family protein [Bacteroidales bacterium]
MTDHKKSQSTNGGDQYSRRLLVSLLAVMTVLSPAELKAEQTTSNGIPKVVVSILIDQLRADYLEAFMPLYGEEGFKRLFRDGRIYSQADYPMANPDCASAAATLATGSAPSSNGIVARRWIDRNTLRPVFCVDDATYEGTGGTTDKSAPKYLGVSTVGDELKVASEGKALVYAIAPFREAAILTAGHAADGAVWIDDQTGQWCSTSYYGSLPAWASVRNSYQSLEKALKSTTWEPSSDLVGNFSYFLSGGMKTPFKHKFKGDDRFSDFKTSGLVNGEVAAAATACLDGTMMGADAITDHLAVTFYAGNFEHRAINDASMELQDTYVRLDRALADLISAVDRKVGLDNALFVVTSTGYTDEVNSDLSKYRIPTGTFDMRKASALLNLYLVAVYGQGNYVEACLGTQMYLNHKLIETKQLNLVEVLERTQDFLMQLEGVKDVYTSQRLMQGAWTPGISRIRSGYNQQYSGDVMVEVASGWHYVNEDTHENQLVRESYISYPIIFFGASVKAEKIETPVTVDRIAPTLSKAMRIRAPNACAVAPLF